MKLENYPNQEVIDFGEKVAAALVDANIRKSLGGLGGCKAYDPADFDPDVLPYVNAYIGGKADSVALIYAAMKSKELVATQIPVYFSLNYKHIGGFDQTYYYEKVISPGERYHPLEDDVLMGTLDSVIQLELDEYFAGEQRYREAQDCDIEVHNVSSQDYIAASDMVKVRT